MTQSPEERFDANNKSYITAAGPPIKLRAIGPGAIDHKRAQFEKLYKRPKAPKRTVDHGKGRTSEVFDTTDEHYQDQLAEYNADVSRKLMEWIIAIGVEVIVPETPEKGSVFEAVLFDEDEIKDTGPMTTLRRRYLYINSIIDALDYAFLTEVIIGQKGVTQFGLDQAAEDFPNNGEST